MKRDYTDNCSSLFYFYPIFKSVRGKIKEFFKGLEIKEINFNFLKLILKWKLTCMWDK